MTLDYEEDMRIDETALDVEWLEQGQLALRYGKHLANLSYKLRRLEEKKKTTRSELIQEANKDPEKCCNKSKTNAGDIEAYYRNHPEYKEVIEELLETQYEAEYAGVAKNEIAFTRRMALENLVRLHGQQYFAGPSIPRDLNKEWERREKHKLANAGVGSKMKRGKKE